MSGVAEAIDNIPKRRIKTLSTLKLAVILLSSLLKGRKVFTTI